MGTPTETAKLLICKRVQLIDATNPEIKCFLYRLVSPPTENEFCTDKDLAGERVIMLDVRFSDVGLPDFPTYHLPDFLQNVYLSSMKNNIERRTFVKSSVMGLGAVSLSPLAKLSTPADAIQQHKLNILCVGAHPGDPEFGCGGTMAKYSNAGNAVTFLYLTRGEAYNDKQSFSKSAELRTKEAETSCKVLNATPLFAGQMDGDTELNKQKNEETTKLILSQKPDIVFTHWPLDAHPERGARSSDRANLSCLSALAELPCLVS